MCNWYTALCIAPEYDGVRICSTNTSMEINPEVPHQPYPLINYTSPYVVTKMSRLAIYLNKREGKKVYNVSKTVFSIQISFNTPREFI